MDSSGALRPLDESLLRELPQLSLRIAPLREPVSSRTLSVPSPLEPNASGARESNNISKSKNSSNISNPKAGLPTVTELLHAARTKKADPAADPHSSVEHLPKPILPAFVNLRALERFPFSSSFDDDALHGPRKRRRLDLQAESFSEHLQLPIPQAQKEQRPPPFGPLAILNGLNEPPPNAALLPPIEPGSITQLLTKPSRADAAVDPSTLVSVNGSLAEEQPVERREARIEELLGATIDNDDDDDTNEHDDPERLRVERRSRVEGSPGKVHASDKKASPSAADGNAPLSPKSRGRSRKNLRKWTEEETIALLRGAVKCGIGNWTTILAQPELEFNKRTASNLKDRFRVCFPWAYRAPDPNEATKQLREKLADILLKSQAKGSDESVTSVNTAPSNVATIGSEPSSGAGSPANTSLNIPDAHVTPASKRRSRRPFTIEEDDALLKGYAAHGFQWTLIQQDKRLNLSHRRATDLRDRFRTKFPHAYRNGGPVSAREVNQSPVSPSGAFGPASSSFNIPDAHVTPESKRRSRRPFTNAEDDAFLKGYAVHGFQWTLIQQDKQLNLSHRRATDLRDRFRTKFPHAYRNGGPVSGSEPNQTPVSSSGAFAPAPQDRPPSSESTPTKNPTNYRPSDTHSRHTSSSGPIDPSLLPSPHGFFESPANIPSAAGLLAFPLDENPASGASSPWDNTLAPMVWDELG